MYLNQVRLNREQSEALTTAVVLLTERCLGDVWRLSAGQPAHDLETVIFDDDVLPPSFRPFYDLDFVRRFLAVLMTVGWKLHARDFYRIGCVAEEIAFHAVILQSSQILHDVWNLDEPEPEFDESAEEYRTIDLPTFCDSVLDDEDFLLLWTRDLVDAQDMDQANQFGFGGLRFTEWFNYFHDDEWNVHPVATWDNDWNWTGGPGMPKARRA